MLRGEIIRATGIDGERVQVVLFFDANENSRLKVTPLEPSVNGEVAWNQPFNISYAYNSQPSQSGRPHPPATLTFKVIGVVQGRSRVLGHVWIPIYSLLNQQDGQMTGTFALDNNGRSALHLQVTARSAPNAWQQPNVVTPPRPSRPVGQKILQGVVSAAAATIFGLAPEFFNSIGWSGEAEGEADLGPFVDGGDVDLDM